MSHLRVVATGAFVLSVASFASAQVTMELRTLTPVSIDVASSGTLVTQNAPMGQIGPGHLQIILADADARSAWNVTGGNGRRTAEWSLSTFANGAGGYAAQPPSQLLVSLTATTWTPVKVTVSQSHYAWPNWHIPSFAIDVHDDGVSEVTPWLTHPVSGSYQLGANPIVIRFDMDAAVSEFGTIQQTLEVLVEPDNNLGLHLVQPACAGGTLSVRPGFIGRGVELEGGGADPQLAVFGFSELGTVLPGSACSLLPSPDIVVFLPTTGLTVPLPGPVRPVTAWIQAVSVLPTGFATSNAIRLVAN